MQKFATIAALALALALAGCNAPNSATTISDINTALAVGCPVVTAVQSSGLRLTNAQRAALNTLALACPPNPPPTAAGVVLVDLVQAYGILAPLVQK
jgi:hypothetical protein